MDNAIIDNRLKASAFNKFKQILYKYYPRFSKNSKISEYLNRFLGLLYGCVTSLS